MATLPTSLSLTVIADGSLAVAADERNNFAAIQTATNSLLTILGAGSTGQFFTGNGTTVSMSYPPGYEIGYDQITANVTVTSNTEATGTTIITCGAHTFDGAPVMAQFFTADLLESATAGVYTIISLFEGATQIGRLAVERSQLAAVPGEKTVNAWLRFTPTAASHTYKVTAHNTGAAADAVITGGASGTGTTVPGFIRFTKV